MAIQLLNVPTPPIGEQADTASQTYYGGMPCRMAGTAGSEVLILCTNDYIACGVYVRSSYDNSKNPPAKAAFVPFDGRWVKMVAGYDYEYSDAETEGRDAAPYVTGLNWQPGDFLYMNTSGYWINYALGTSCPQLMRYGYILKAPVAGDESIEAILQLYPVPCEAGAIGWPGP